MKINQNKLYEFCIKILHLSLYSMIPILVLAGMVILFTFLFFGKVIADINNSQGMVQILLGYCLPMLLCLIIGPLFFEIKIRKRRMDELGLVLKKNRILIFLIVILFSMSAAYLAISKYPENGLEIVISFVFVAFGEEFYTRGVLMLEIDKMWGKKTAIVLSSFIFAFLFHSSSLFWINLVFRFPLALVLALIRDKSGDIYISSCIHFIYNILVNI